jgi:hypothetical protein
MVVKEIQNRFQYRFWILGLIGTPGESCSFDKIYSKMWQFWIILEYFSNAHMCFSVADHSGQNLKKAVLSLEINFFQIFRHDLNRAFRRAVNFKVWIIFLF